MRNSNLDTPAILRLSHRDRLVLLTASKNNEKYSVTNECLFNKTESRIVGSGVNRDQNGAVTRFNNTLSSIFQANGGRAVDPGTRSVYDYKSEKFPPPNRVSFECDANSNERSRRSRQMYHGLCPITGLFFAECSDKRQRQVPMRVSQHKQIR